MEELLADWKDIEETILQQQIIHTQQEGHKPWGVLEIIIILETVIILLILPQMVVSDTEEMDKEQVTHLDIGEVEREAPDGMVEEVVTIIIIIPRVQAVLPSSLV